MTARHVIARRTTARRTTARHPTAPSSARGAAYVEAILLILFMIIIFSGVVYLGNYFEARQRAQGTARRCAWVYSWNACESVPAGCQGVVGEPKTEVNDQLRDGVLAAQNAEVPGAPAPKDAETAKNVRQGVTDEMTPFYEMLFGQNISARSEHSVQRPASLPNAEASVGATYYLPCNLKHEEPLPAAIRLFTKVLGGGPLTGK